MVSAISFGSRAGVAHPADRQQFQGIDNVVALPGATTARALAVGATLCDGRFRVGRSRGHGSLGDVYEGFDELHGRRVAIRELLPDTASRVDGQVVPMAGHRAAFAAARERFIQEAARLEQVNHPGVVKVVCYFEEGGTVYLVLEKVEGISLREVLRRRGGPLSEAEVFDVMSRCAPAVGAVHRVGLVHRDICPENLVRTDDGRVILTGFDLGRPPADPMATHHRWSWYAAPETATGAATAASDVFSLGATIYGLLAGAEPAAGAGAPGPPPALWRLNPTVSPNTSQTVTAAMDRDMRSRPASAEALLRALGVESKSGLDVAPLALRSIDLARVESDAAVVAPGRATDLVELRRSPSSGVVPLAPVVLPAETELEVVIDITDRALGLLDRPVDRQPVDWEPANRETLDRDDSGGDHGEGGEFDEIDLIDLRHLMWPEGSRFHGPPPGPPSTTLRIAPAWRPVGPVAPVVPVDAEAVRAPTPEVGSEGGPATSEAEAVWAPAPPGRWWVTVPLGLAAVAVTTAQPVSLALVLGLVVAPALATVGDRLLRPHRRPAMLSVWAVRNLLIASVRSLGTVAVLAVGMCLWFGTQGISALAGYGPMVLRGTGLVAGGLLATSMSKGGAGFHSHLALDGLTRALAPRGRVTVSVVLLGLICAAMVAAGLSLEPEAWPLR